MRGGGVPPFQLPRVIEGGVDINDSREFELHPWGAASGVQPLPLVRLHPRRGWDDQRGPPFLVLGGRLHPRAKWAAHHFTLGCSPPPHGCQCRPGVQLKFLVGINLSPPPPPPTVIPTSNGNGQNHIS